jgi:hypothetical protein
MIYSVVLITFKTKIKRGKNYFTEQVLEIMKLTGVGYMQANNPII